MNVVGYYRFSTDSKNQIDNSEDRQSEIVERMVYGNAREGWKLIGSYTDEAISGTDEKPELMRLKEAVESGAIKVDIIAVDSLSRLTRRSLRKVDKDIAWIEEAGIKLSVAAKDSGRPFTVDAFDDDLSVMVEQHQNNQYVKKLSREVTNGLRTKFRKGDLGWVGKAPYGYDLKKKLDEPSTLVPNEDLPLVEDIFRKFISGYSIRSLVAVLERTKQYKEGRYVRPNGSTVKNILRSSIYAGIRTFGVRGVGKHNTVSGHKRSSLNQSPLIQAESYQEYRPEGFESIVTIDEYNEVQQKLDSNSKAFRKFPERHNHKFSGLLRCMHCNSPLGASTWKNPKTGEVKISYTCSVSGDGTEDCKEGDAPYRKSIRTDELDTMITKKIGITMMDKSFHRRNFEEVVKRLERRSESNITFIEEDLFIQNKRLDDLMDLFERSQSPTLMERIDKQTIKIDKIKKKVSETVEEDKLLEFAQQQCQTMDVAGPLQAYYGFIYEGSVKILGLKEPDDRQELLEFGVDELVKLWTKCFSEGIEPLRKIYDKPDLQWEDLEGIKMNGPDDLMMKTLKSMGLDHIKVNWELGLWRGKPRRVPTELVFVFSLAPEEYTDKGLLFMSNQKIEFSETRLP